MELACLVACACFGVSVHHIMVHGVGAAHHHCLVLPCHCCCRHHCMCAELPSLEPLRVTPPSLHAVVVYSAAATPPAHVVQVWHCTWHMSCRGEMLRKINAPVPWKNKCSGKMSTPEK